MTTYCNHAGALTAQQTGSNYTIEHCAKCRRFVVTYADGTTRYQFATTYPTLSEAHDFATLPGLMEWNLPHAWNNLP
jgi:hypothetical protein